MNSPTAAPFLSLQHIHKSFSGVHALNDLSLELMQGEIHCLAGENGSGKSTLIKTISGVHAPDSGEIRIEGELQPRLTPALAIEKGVQVIYQDFSLFANLTVAENLAFNTLLARRERLINWRTVRRMAAEALARLKIEVDLDRRLSTLSVAQKQLVAIARALMFDARLLIMDEPTTALTQKEINVLFEIVADIKAQGISVLFVSHKMREMLEISDRITVIRNGGRVAGGGVEEFDEKLLTWHMTGQELTSTPPPPLLHTEDAPRLALTDFAGDGFADINLRLAPGEIVGLTGLLGSGRTEFAQALFGMDNSCSGRVEIDGAPVTLHSIQKAIACGIAYLPEDRLSEGLFLQQSILRNIFATTLEQQQGFLFNRRKATKEAVAIIGELAVTAADINNPVSTLSGGNQQRIVLGKWLLTGAKVLILNGPTVGVDIGSKAEIHRKIREIVAASGLAVLMISDDIQELVHNCHRILLMHQGRFVHEIEAAGAEENDINQRLRELA